MYVFSNLPIIEYLLRLDVRMQEKIETQLKHNVLINKLLRIYSKMVKSSAFLFPHKNH